MKSTLWRAFGALGIAAVVVFAAPSALSSSKKTPTPAADAATSKEKTADKAKTEKVNLNTADEKEIAAAKGVGAKLAKALVAGRPYKTWDDVSKVKGVGSGKKLDSLRKVLKLSDGVGSAAAKEDTAVSGSPSKKTKKTSSKGEEGSAAGAGAAAGGAAAGSSAASGKSSASAESSSSSRKSSSSPSTKLAAGEVININTASAEELDKLPEIGPVKAKAIVDYRDANGKFTSIEDIMKVPGIKEGTFAKIKGHIVVK